MKNSKGIPFQELEKPEKSLPFWQLMKMQKPEWPWLLMGIIGFIGTGLIPPTIGILYGEIFKVFTLTGIAFEQARIFWSCLFVGFAVYSGILFLIQTKGMTEANEKLIARTRGSVFENILKQPVGWFDMDTSSPGILINRLARNAPLIKAAAGLRMGNVLSATVTITFSFVIAFVFSWKLALVLALFVPLMLFLYVKQQSLMTERLHKDNEQMDTAGNVASEAVRNIRTVQALGQEKQFTELYSTKLNEPYREAKKRIWLYAFMYAVAQGISFFMYAIAFKYGGFLIEIGDLTADNMYKVFFSLSLCTTSVATMFTFIQDFTKARHSIRLLNYLLCRRSEIDSASSTGARPEINGKIEFKNVHFSYPARPAVKVLRGLKFTVDAGKTLALVGESGCGKSTVVSLIERFYDPTSGGILVDDYDIRTLNVSHLRSKIGIVTQEPILFDTTIRENIAYGAFALQNEVPVEQIFRAAKLANIHDFIMKLPERYETMVGERGVQLSGGQKQRLAIARALIRDPKILLLDEATSALDTQSEKVVQVALDKAKQGRTCIIVAHRLSTIRNADTICVLHKGKVVERGTHDELQAKEGLYFQLTQKQLLL